MNLLFGLAVVAFGVSCFLLPINIVKGCPSSDEESIVLPDYKWETNISAVPEAVRPWARNNDGNRYNPVATFAYVDETKTTIFQGKGEDRSHHSKQDTSGSSLWTVGPDAPPQWHADYIAPQSFVVISNSSVCFTSYFEGHDPGTKICCSDGNDIRVATSAGPLFNTGWIGQFLPSGGRLWFKLFDEPTAPGTLIYSLDPEDMSTKLFSRKIKNGDSDHSQSTCNRKKRIQAIAILLVAALPFTLASIFVWYSHQVSSMAVTTYAGLTAIFACVYGVIDPRMLNSRYSSWWFQLWFSVSGAVGLVLCTYFHLSECTQKASKPTFQWGLVLGGLSFGNGIIQILEMDNDTLGGWILLNIMVFGPLLLVGMINGNLFLVFLGGVGFLADAARLGALIGDHVSAHAREPVTFLVFSLTGLGAGFLGFRLSKYQLVVHDLAKYGVERIDDCLNHACAADDSPILHSHDYSTDEQSLFLFEGSGGTDANEEELPPTDSGSATNHDS